MKYLVLVAPWAAVVGVAAISPEWTWLVVPSALTVTFFFGDVIYQ